MQCEDRDRASAISNANAKKELSSLSFYSISLFSFYLFLWLKFRAAC